MPVRRSSKRVTLASTTCSRRPLVGRKGWWTHGKWYSGQNDWQSSNCSMCAGCHAVRRGGGGGEARLRAAVNGLQTTTVRYCLPLSAWPSL